MTLVEEPSRFITRSGQQIYRMPLLVFSGLIVNTYLVVDGSYCALIDTGTGKAASNEQLERHLEIVRERWGKRIRLEQIDRVIVTHGHLDHHGGADFMRKHTGAPISMHALDRGALDEPEAHFGRMRRSLEAYMTTAGAGEEDRAALISLFTGSRAGFEPPGNVESVADGDRIDGRFTVHHAPGHCAGQICLEMDEVLFSADHILEQITPNVPSARAHPGNGLTPYFASLARMRERAEIRLVLGGHEGEMLDLKGRVDQVMASHERKLERFRQALSVRPRGIYDLTREFYSGAKGYHQVFALLETGAHVEYLLERGEVEVAGHAAVNAGDAASDLYYCPSMQTW